MSDITSSRPLPVPEPTRAGFGVPHRSGPDATPADPSTLHRQRRRATLSFTTAIVLVGIATTAFILRHPIEQKIKPMIQTFRHLHPALVHEAGALIPAPVVPGKVMADAAHKAAALPLPPMAIAAPVAGTTGPQPHQGGTRSFRQPADVPHATTASAGTTQASAPVARKGAIGNEAPSAGSSMAASPVVSDKRSTPAVLSSVASEYDTMLAAEVGRQNPGTTIVDRPVAVPSFPQLPAHVVADRAANAWIAAPPPASLRPSPTVQATALAITPRPVTPAANQLMAVSHPLNVARKIVAAPDAPQEQVAVLSLVSQMGVLVAELRNQNTALSHEVAFLKTEMNDRLDAFGRRLNYEQAKSAIALATDPVTKAKPSIHPHIFDPAPRRTVKPVNPTAYRVQAASPGIAILMRDGQSYQVSIGDVVPGVGQVLSITEYGTRWVVKTTHGSIR